MPGAVKGPWPRAPGGARRCEGSACSARGRNQAELPAMGGLRAPGGGGAAGTQVGVGPWPRAVPCCLRLLGLTSVLP